MKWGMPAVCAAVLLILLSGCRKQGSAVADCGIFAGGCAVWPDSVGLPSGITIVALDDSTLGVTVEGNLLRNVRVGRSPKGNMSITSGFPVIDLLCRLEASVAPLPPRHQLLPYLIYLNPFSRDDAEELLRSRLKNGYVVPSETRAYSWPVVNDNAPWLMAAAELYCARGGNRWLEELGEVAAASVELDYALAFNPSTRLFSGLPRYMLPVESGDRLFPDWMDATDLPGVQSLGVNVAYWDALARMEQTTAYLATVNVRSRLPDLPVSADTLRLDILSRYWQPRGELLSGMLYGCWLWPVPLDAADNLAAALAVSTGMLPPPMARRVVAGQFAEMRAATLFTPSLASEQSYGGSLLEAVTRTAWIMAANDVAETDAVELMLGQAIRQQAEALLSPESDMLRLGSLSASLIRGILGVKVAPSGMRFSPVVPSGLKGDMHFGGLRYRRALLDVTLSGTGSIIESFRLDGEEAPPRLPATLRGRHAIEISMAQAQASESLSPGKDISPEKFEAPRQPAQLPPVPVVRWLTPLRGALEASAGESLLRINGVATEYIAPGVFTVDEQSVAGCVQVSLTDAEGYSGFSSAPHWFFPKGTLKVFPASACGTPGTKLVKNKALQKQLVESHRYRNSSIVLHFNAPQAGKFALEAEFLSGLGIVNRRWRNAVRGVWVNGRRVGSMVLSQNPQMRPSADASERSASSDDSWERMVSASRPIAFYLPGGPSEIELRYVQPSPVFVDPTANNALFRSFRIFRIE